MSDTDGKHYRHLAIAAAGLLSLTGALAVLLAPGKVARPSAVMTLSPIYTNASDVVFAAWLKNQTDQRIRVFPAVVRFKQVTGSVVDSPPTPWDFGSVPRLTPGAATRLSFFVSNETQQVKVIAQYQWPAGLVKRKVGTLLLRSPWRPSISCWRWLQDRGWLGNYVCLLESSWVNNPLAEQDHTKYHSDSSTTQTAPGRLTNILISATQAPALFTGEFCLDLALSI